VFPCGPRVGGFRCLNYSKPPVGCQWIQNPQQSSRQRRQCMKRPVNDRMRINKYDFFHGILCCPHHGITKTGIYNHKKRPEQQVRSFQSRVHRILLWRQSNLFAAVGNHSWYEACTRIGSGYKIGLQCIQPPHNESSGWRPRSDITGKDQRARGARQSYKRIIKRKPIIAGSDNRIYRVHTCSEHRFICHHNTTIYLLCL